VETRPSTNNFDSCDLILRGRSQALQFFAWNYMTSAIAQLEDQQVQSRTGPIFHLSHQRLLSQFLGPFDGAIDLAIASDDSVPESLTPRFPIPTIPVSHALTPRHA
jgi:hypothetical protein